MATKKARTLRELEQEAAAKEAIRAVNRAVGRECPHCGKTDFAVEDTRDVRGGARNRTLRCLSCDGQCISSEVITKAL